MIVSRNLSQRPQPDVRQDPRLEPCSRPHQALQALSESCKSCSFCLFFHPSLWQVTTNSGKQLPSMCISAELMVINRTSQVVKTNTFTFRPSSIFSAFLWFSNKVSEHIFLLRLLYWRSCAHQTISGFCWKVSWKSYIKQQTSHNKQERSILHGIISLLESNSSEKLFGCQSD